MSLTTLFLMKIEYNTYFYLQDVNFTSKHLWVFHYSYTSLTPIQNIKFVIQFNTSMLLFCYYLCFQYNINLDLVSQDKTDTHDFFIGFYVYKS